MTARGLQSTSLVSARNSVGNALLPFLYRTRTILIPTFRACKAQRPLHTSQSKRAAYVRRAASRDAVPFESESRFEQPNRPIRFVNSPEPITADASSSRPDRQSTITASEKAVFDRLFNDISDDVKKSAAKQAAKHADPLGDDAEDVTPARNSINGSLDGMFDAALANQSKVPAALNGAPKKAIYKTAIDPFLNTGWARLDRSIIRGDESSKDVREAVVEHKRKVFKMLQEAKTDHAIWKILDLEVFPLVRQYEAHTQEVGKKAKSPKPTRNRGRVSKADQAATAEAGTQQAPASVLHPSFQQRKIQAILSMHYGEYCLAAMRQLRRSHPASPYCMNILPTIKRLGPISHVLGATPDLYNEVLFLRWKEYSDLNGMADLLTEMSNHAIERTHMTLYVLKLVRSSMYCAYAPQQNPSMKLWWELITVQNGMQRLRNLARELSEEVTAAKERSLKHEADLAARKGEEARMRNGRNAHGEVASARGMTRQVPEEEKPRLGSLRLEPSAGAGAAAVNANVEPLSPKPIML
ncbi:MAG: hypothetical protein Q9174_004669 [Haloplaca sp. 1 TL-2023]